MFRYLAPLRIFTTPLLRPREEIALSGVAAGRLRSAAASRRPRCSSRRRRRLRTWDSASCSSRAGAGRRRRPRRRCWSRRCCPRSRAQVPLTASALARDSDVDRRRGRRHRVCCCSMGRTCSADKPDDMMPSQIGSRKERKERKEEEERTMNLNLSSLFAPSTLRWTVPVAVE